MTCAESVQQIVQQELPKLTETTFWEPVYLYQLLSSVVCALTPQGCYFISDGGTVCHPVHTHILHPGKYKFYIEPSSSLPLCWSLIGCWEAALGLPSD